MIRVRGLEHSGTRLSFYIILTRITDRFSTTELRIDARKVY